MVGVIVGTGVVVADGIGEGVTVNDGAAPPPPVSGGVACEEAIWVVLAPRQALVRRNKKNSRYLIAVWCIFIDVTCKKLRNLIIGYIMAMRNLQLIKFVSYPPFPIR